MVHIRGGQIVQQQGGASSILEYFWAFFNAIAFFLHTIISPEANDKYRDHARKKGWGGGNGNNRRGPGGGGGGGGGGDGPRISGMGNLPSSRNPPCGPGGCCGGGGCG